jgi:hypothetical protein
MRVLQTATLEPPRDVGVRDRGTSEHGNVAA